MSGPDLFDSLLTTKSQSSGSCVTASSEGFWYSAFLNYRGGDKINCR